MKIKRVQCNNRKKSFEVEIFSRKSRQRMVWRKKDAQNGVEHLAPLKIIGDHEQIDAAQ